MSVRQAIKAGIASFVVLLVTNWFQLAYPVYAVIAIVFVMESSLPGSLRAGFNRLLGTAIGTSMAAASAAAADLVLDAGVGADT